MGLGQRAKRILVHSKNFKSRLEGLEDKEESVKQAKTCGEATKAFDKKKFDRFKQMPSFVLQFITYLVP